MTSVESLNFIESEKAVLSYLLSIARIKIESDKFVGVSILVKTRNYYFDDAELDQEEKDIQELLKLSKKNYYVLQKCLNKLELMQQIKLRDVVGREYCIWILKNSLVRLSSEGRNTLKSL